MTSSTLSLAGAEVYVEETRKEGHKEPVVGPMARGTWTAIYQFPWRPSLSQEVHFHHQNNEPGFLESGLSLGEWEIV